MIVVGTDGKVFATRLGAQSGTTAKSLEQRVSDSLARPSGKWINRRAFRAEAAQASGRVG